MRDIGNKKVMAANIKRYMGEKGITAKDLSKALDVPYTTVLSWIKAEYYPRIDKIEKMSEFFGILKSDLIEDKNSKMKKCSDRITEALNIRGMKQADLCAKTGIPKSAISQYVSGAFEPKQDRLMLIAQALEVSPVWLMGFDVPMEQRMEIPTATNIIPMPEAKSIPLVGKIACGTPITATENLEGYIKIPAQLEADFALVCRGDSMVGARIMDGDFVAIRQQPDVDDGDIAAVLIEDEATLKRVYKMPGRLVLRAENPRYAPIDLSGAELDDVRILGKVVYFISKVN